MGNPNNYFTPNGECPMWQIVYDIGKTAQIGEVYTWEKLRALTGFDIKVNKYRGLIYKANTHLLKNNNKRFVSVRGFGYKIAPPPEQLNEAQKRGTKASRQMKKGILEATCIDKSKLTNDQKVWTTHLITKYQSTLHIIRKRSAEDIKLHKETVAKNKKAIAQQEATLTMVNSVMEEMQKLKGFLNE